MGVVIDTDLGSGSVAGLVVILAAVTVVDAVTDVDLSVGVALIWLTVAKAEAYQSAYRPMSCDVRDSLILGR